jgi:AGZA family xanthine/uracil permease-like MFS transporter
VIERLFHVTASGSTIRTEILAGLTTFVTMAYIIFVQPTVLSAAGMDFGAVLVATCLASAFATLLMAFLANYPIAVAPAMGHNFFFAYTVVGLMKVPWQIALGGVAVAGMIFIVTAGIGFRERVITAIPDGSSAASRSGLDC